MTSIHAAIEGLTDWWLQWPDRWQRWRDRRFRAALRRANRKRRERANKGVIYVDTAPDPKCVVPNMRNRNDNK